MSKDQPYHETAVKYNETLAKCAEDLAPELEDPVIKKWCVGVGRQHRFHENRHRMALAKILSKEAETVEVELIDDGLDVPEPTDESETEAILADPDTTAAIAEAEAELAAESVAEATAEEYDSSTEEEVQNTNNFSDGCVSAHKPLENTNCDFNPNKAVVTDA